MSSPQLPGEGTIATERVLGVVAGTRRAVCARRVAGALLAPAAQARLAAVRGLLPVRAATCAALAAGACTAAPARALAHAREQLGGRPSRGRARASPGWPEWVGEWVLLRG